MKALFFDCGTRDSLASWGLLLLRGCSGLMMAIGHGWPKAASFTLLKDEWFVPGFLGFLSPPVSLMLTIAAELVAALLLVFGLATRPAAAVLVFTMGMAAFGALGSAPLFMAPGVEVAKEPALLYLLPALVLMITGGGARSLDALISKPKRRSRYA